MERRASSIKNYTTIKNKYLESDPDKLQDGYINCFRSKFDTLNSLLAVLAKVGMPLCSF